MQLVDGLMLEVKVSKLLVINRVAHLQLRLSNVLHFRVSLQIALTNYCHLYKINFKIIYFLFMIFLRKNIQI